MTQPTNKKQVTPFAMQFLEVPLDQTTGGCPTKSGGGGQFMTEAISAPIELGGAADRF
jgi:hypothetical protein